MQPILADETWTHFIGDYTCYVEKKFDLSDVRQSPKFTTYLRGQTMLSIGINLPLVEPDQERCATDAIIFAKAVRGGSGASAFGAFMVMDEDCNSKINLVLKKFSLEPSNQNSRLLFTNEFVDVLDSHADGGLNFNGGRLGDVFHLAGDWHFSYTKPLTMGGLTWYTGQCEKK